MIEALVFVVAFRSKKKMPLAAHCFFNILVIKTGPWISTLGLLMRTVGIRKSAIRALAWRGRLVIVGFAAGRIPTIKANHLLLKNIEASGVQVSDYRKRKPGFMAECIRDVFTPYNIGKLRPAPAIAYPRKEFATAPADIRDRRVVGRIRSKDRMQRHKLIRGELCHSALTRLATG